MAIRIPALLIWRSRLLGMFNLNDGQWGRGSSSGSTPPPDQGQSSNNEDSPRPQRPAGQDGPPDLDELWRDFQNRMGGLFGKRPRGPSGPRQGGGYEPPNPRAARVGAGLVASLLVLIWLGTGFFIVQEGQQAVITQFGKYHSTVGAGFNWRLPYPIQAHEKVFVTQIRSVDIGSNAIVSATGLKESSMLTADENIVDIKFAVQYRLSDARAYLFESQNPDDAVIKAAETAVREVVGKMRMDSALAEERDQIAPNVRSLMQTILDRYQVGIEVVGVNLQQGGVRPPEEVQAAFDDVLKAAQERERAKNEAQAYANDVVPRARGQASRLLEEAQAYKARIVAQAQGDAQRFNRIYEEYRKAPQVTRDRIYVDTMRDMYSNVTKVVIESKQGSNLLYLPLDKIIQSTTQDSLNAIGAAASPAPASTPAPASAATNQSANASAPARENPANLRARETR
ncbi:MAG: FtsH protease modulator HflK [Pseudomonadota bacterium]